MTKMIKKILIAALLVASFTIVYKTTDVAAAAPKTHTVTFMYGTKIFPELVFHGGNAIAPTDTYVPGYSFMGWVGGSLYNVTEDRIILGSYAVVQPTVVCADTSKKSDDHHDECWCHRHSCWYRWRCPWCDDWYEWEQAKWRAENEAYKEYWDDVNHARSEAVEVEREIWREENKDWNWRRWHGWDWDEDDD